MKQLIAELDGLAEDMGRDGATGVNTVASASQQLARLERENTALRNEIARLNGQTMWICSCGGTDCAGQKENAALRGLAERMATEMREIDQEFASLRDYDAARQEAQP